LKKRILQLLLAFSLTAFLVWRVGPIRLFRDIGSSDLRMVAAGFFVVALAVLLKASRARLILRRRLHVAGLFRIILFQDVFNNFLPAKAGEFSYVLMLKREGVPVGEGIASLVLARVGDFAAAATLFYVSIALLPGLRLSIVIVSLPAAAIVLGALLVICAAVLFKDRFSAVLARLMALLHIPERLDRSLRKYASDLLIGLNAPRQRHVLPFVFSLSIITWLLAALCLYLWSMALGPVLGAHLTFWQCAFIETILVVLSILPIQALLGPAAIEGSLLGLFLLFKHANAPEFALATLVFLSVYYLILMPFAIFMAPKSTEGPTAELPQDFLPSR